MQGGETQTLSLCEGDQDWFQAVIPPGLSASFRIQHNSSFPPLKGTVYSSDGTPLSVESELKELGNDVIQTWSTPNFPAGEAIAFKVEGPDGGVSESGVPYILQLEIAEEVCVEEDGEDNGTQEQGVKIPVFGVPVDGGFCGADYADWYLVDLAPGETVSLEVAFEQTYGQLLLHLYAPDAGVLAAVGELASWNGGRVIGLSVPPWWPSGEYGLLVTGDYSSNYEILAQKYPGPLCEAEVGEHEPNGSLLTATEFLLGQSVNSGVCGGDTDVFRIDVNPANPFTLQGQFSNPGGWLNVTVQNRDGTELVSENVLSEEMEWVIPAEDLLDPSVFVVVKSGLSTSVEFSGAQ